MDTIKPFEIDEDFKSFCELYRKQLEDISLMTGLSYREIYNFVENFFAIKISISRASLVNSSCSLDFIISLRRSEFFTCCDI